MTALLTIDGVDLPTPSGFVPGIQDIVNAERNANGTMIMDRIATKRKLELSWKFLTAEQLAQVFAAVSTSNFFDVTYPDPLTGQMETKTFYAGDRNAGMIDFRNGVPRYRDVKFDLIER